MCREGPHYVLELAKFGADFTRCGEGHGAACAPEDGVGPGGLHLTREGGHSARRIVHAAGEENLDCLERAWQLAAHRQSVDSRNELHMPPHAVTCLHMSTCPQPSSSRHPRIHPCPCPPCLPYLPADATGAEIERALVTTAAAHPNIHFFEHHLAVDLLSECSAECVCRLAARCFFGGGAAAGAWVLRLCIVCSASAVLRTLPTVPLPAPACRLQLMRWRACATAWVLMCWTSTPAA